MIIPDHKRMASIIVASLRPKTGEMTMGKDTTDEQKPEDGTDDNKEALKATAEEIMQAIESKDAQAFADSLSDFIEMAMGTDDDSDEDSADDVTDMPASDMKFPSIGIK